MGHRYSKHSVVTIQPTSTMMSGMSSQQMHQLNLAKKRAVIRNNKHFNLMSLDENALNLYRDHHRMLMNVAHHNNPNMTIPENPPPLANTNSENPEEPSEQLGHRQSSIKKVNLSVRQRTLPHKDIRI
jgi:hypothetical protein